MNLQPLSAMQARSVVEATARLNIWHGPVRSGKTFASIIKWAQAVDQAKGIGDLVMIGKTERTLERNVLRPLEMIFGTDAVDIRLGSGTAYLFGKKVDVIGAADERSEQKVRGGTFEKVYGDELTLWPESLFKMVTSRMSDESAQLFGTTNPDAPMHWLKASYLDRRAILNSADPSWRPADRKGIRDWHFKLTDNETLAASVVATMKAEYSGLWKKRFIDGLWVLAEGVIWDSYDEDIHVVDGFPPGVRPVRHLVSVDYGTTAPFVALLIAYGSDGIWYVVDEYVHDSKLAQHQLTDLEYAQAVKAWLEVHGVSPDRMWVDPSAASFRLQARSSPFYLPVVDAENDVNDGLRTVARAFAARRLVIFRRCTTLRATVAGYCWDEDARQRGVERPRQRDDHAPDALRYGLFSEDQHPFTDLGESGWLA